MNSIDRWIKQLHLRAGSTLDERVHADIDRALADTQTTVPPTTGRTIMISSFTKLAAAAAVVLAGLLGWNMLSGPHGEEMVQDPPAAGAAQDARGIRRPR